MKRSPFAVMLIVLLAAAITLTTFGCAPAAPAPTAAPPPAPTKAAAPAPAASTPAPVAPTKPAAAAPAATAPAASTAQPVTLRLAYHGAQGDPLADGVEWWTKEVEKRTNGAVKFQIYWSESLVKGTEMLDAARMGTTDLATLININFEPLLPILFFDAVPFTTVDSGVASSIMWQMFDEFPQLEEVFVKLNQKMVTMFPVDSVEMISKKPLASLADFQGKKIRGWGKYNPKWWSAVGATPVTMPAVDVYDALSKGTIDTAPGGFTTIYRYKWYEAAKNGLYIKRGANVYYQITVHLPVWNKLSPDVQKAMLGAGRDTAGKMAEIMTASETRMLKAMTDAGVKFVELPAAEQQRWKNMPVMKEGIESWVKAIEDKGLPGRAIMDRYLALNKW